MGEHADQLDRSVRVSPRLGNLVAKLGGVILIGFGQRHQRVRRGAPLSGTSSGANSDAARPRFRLAAVMSSSVGPSTSPGSTPSRSDCVEARSAARASGVFGHSSRGIRPSFEKKRYCPSIVSGEITV